MHAVVINVTLNDRPGVDAELTTLVPQVAAAPGFVAAVTLPRPTAPARNSH